MAKGNNLDKDRHLLKRFSARTNNQRSYIRAIIENDIVFCIGPAGTGKTACAVGIAVEWLCFNKIEKIVITRPVIESGNGLGFLPGDLRAKTDPYIRPIMDELVSYLGKARVEIAIQAEEIEIAPLEFMRGRTFKNSFVILDEAQNATFDQMKMFLTRIGEGSVLVINGDTDQMDIPIHDSALEPYFDEMDTGGLAKIRLTEEDIVRHSIITRLLVQIKKVEQNRKNLRGRN